MKSTVQAALLLVAFVSSVSFAAEPSAFGAGDLTAASPYGLTSSEKVILQTKKTLKKVAINTKSQASELDSLRERIDGIQSIVENLSIKSHNNKINLQKFKEDNKANIDNIHEFQTRLGEQIQKNTQAIEKLRVMILELSKVVDKINADYVSKDEFNTLVTDVNNFKALVAKEIKSRKSSAKSSKISSAELYNQAKAYFDKKYYTKAIQDYKELIKRKYKPAYAHYMIGEMNFKRKNYAQAISYFKKSASLYDKASYMPKLMLHTAIAMDKTGDKEHAKAFYNAVVVKYPKSKEAKEAKKHLGLT
ncbi:tetratricopeptide repeat protein [Sulfurimonas autotrophica]|uniref:Tetratricopeptide TPR_2 repeat protein n=1 Tax=Sulfurimonas autotrophica (strain ATCC BAA-671 / DSM 16294 / JCM 11897 / OK10) TaxID=563040 RepID=E0UQV1_SULAO|nr:tetratricopeptide repeat protein [Sulfurimonas autotrophica]ADN08832.1 Tetratricopeptide TPR_2 repeat protein [Sulfurimonas autotrophica DSM 16294]